MEIIEDLRKSIQTNILKDFANIHNAKNGKGYTAYINGKSIKPKTTIELANLIYNEIATKKNGEPWFLEINKEVIKEYHNTNKPVDELWKELLSDEIKSYLTAKVEYRDSITKASIPDVFNADFKACTFKPRNFVNDKDLEYLKGLCYCEANDMFYFNLNGNYTMIGFKEDLCDKKSKSCEILYNLIADRYCEETGRSDFRFWPDLYDSCDKLTNEFFAIRSEIDTQLKSGLTKGFNVNLFNHSVPVENVLKILPNENIPDNWQDKLHSAIVKYGINELLPSAMFCNNLANIYYETIDDVYFKRYSLRSPNGIVCSFNAYLSKLFEESNLIKRNIPHINVVPRIISDIDTIPAQYYIHKDWMSQLTDQKKPEDCKIYNTFISKYRQEEKIAIMAWAYTVFHPSYGDSINFCLKTGGGTFKTNYYTAIINKILKLMYVPKTDNLVYSIISDRWTVDRFLLESNSGGVSVAALVNNDECTEKSLEEFKNMSGGAIEGVNYQKRTMRTNPDPIKIFCKWLFTTNNDINIQDASGAFDRRIFIIDRMDIKNLTPPYNFSEYPNEIMKEIKSFYEIAKNAYEYVVKNFGNLLNYVKQTECIAQNLQQAYKEDEKTFCYYTLFDELTTTKGITTHTDGSISLKAADLKKIATTICEDQEIKYEGLIKWIKGTNKTTKQCEYKPVKIGLKAEKRYRLYPLKKSVIDELMKDVT